MIYSGSKVITQSRECRFEKEEMAHLRISLLPARGPVLGRHEGRLPDRGSRRGCPAPLLHLQARVRRLAARARQRVQAVGRGDQVVLGTGGQQETRVGSLHLGETKRPDCYGGVK